jgi:hypothetical protein
MRNVYTLTLIGLGITSLGLMHLFPNQPTRSTPATAITTMPQAQPPKIASVSSPPRYVRPTVADNGSPFPVQSGYIAKYPQKFTDGYSSVTIDNSKNDSDLLIKLFSLDSQPPIPVSVFLVRGKDTFTVQEIRAGRYEVRYQNLDSGALARTDSFSLKETQVNNGTEFSKLTLILHKVVNGNMQTYPISAADFKS